MILYVLYLTFDVWIFDIWIFYILCLMFVQGITYNNMTNMVSGIANGTFFPNATVCATTGCAPPICGPTVCLDNRSLSRYRVPIPCASHLPLPLLLSPGT